jgi:2-polyprenyl-6-hydroxyphenyl methylase/3-demethylubiquinone-9 3-methyltransferase
MSQAWKVEVETGERFKFGENWRRFLSTLNPERIAVAEQSLREMLGVNSLIGRTFLDIGSGSGLFSLAAKRLGAQVTSFDFDTESVKCTEYLKEHYGPSVDWTVKQGSILDREFLSSLRQSAKFDVVYSWGVLHHTGQMWAAIENTISMSSPGTIVFISIYNDQGVISKFWKQIKKIYCALPSLLKPFILLPAFILLWGPATLLDILSGKGFSRWRNYITKRGMSPIYDVIDWVGGYPFEVAKPEHIFEFFKERGFELLKFTTVTGHGCNQYVFRQLG